MTHEVLVDALVATTGLGIVVWVASVIARRSSAALRHTLWRIALAGFWLVPLVLVTANVLDLDAYAVRVPILPTAEVTQSTEAIGPQGSGSPATGVPSPAPAASHETRAQQAVTAGRIDVAKWLLLLWMTGAVFGGACFVRNMYSVRRLLSQSSSADDPILTARAIHWAAKIGLEKVPALAESETVVVPTVAGWRAPVILLPSGFAVSDAGSDAIIVHELAHVHRGDVATVWLARFTRTLWWWHPLVWLIAHKLRSSAEEACDNWAIALTERRKAYAGVLVHWAEVGASASNLACAYQGKALIRRIKRILTERRIPMLQLSGRMKAVLAICAFCAVVAAGTLRVAPTQAQSSGVTAQTGSVHTVTIGGKVLGPDGKGVAEAQIMIGYRDPQGSAKAARTVSSPDGSFSCRLQVRDPAHPVQVAAVKEGLALNWTPAKPGEDFVLKLGADPVTCAGVVTGPDGEPIAGAQVWVWSIRHTETDDFPTWPTMEDILARSLTIWQPDNTFLGQFTGVEGKFEFRGLPADGIVHIAANAEGRANFRSLDDMPAGKQDITIVMQPEAVISGRVTHQGEPVAGVHVFCQAQDHAAPGWGETVTGQDGTFRLRHLPATTYNVMLDPPEGLTAKAIEGMSLQPGEHFTGAALQLTPGGLVQGVVSDSETGKPLADAWVAAYGPARPTSSAGVQATHTDGTGRYTLRLPEGENKVYSAGTEYGDYEMTHKWVNVVEGQTLTGVDLIIRPSAKFKGTLHGKTIGPDGRPIGGVEVAAIGASFARTFEEYFKVKADAAGNFELKLEGRRLPLGWYVLARDAKRGLAGAKFMETSELPAEPIEVRLSQGGYILARVVDTEGNPVPDIPMDITMAPRWRGALHSISGPQTDKGGKVRIGPLPAGLYVTLSPGDEFRLLTVKSSEKAVIPARGEYELTSIVLNLAGRSMQGWVRDEEQKPVEGAFVFVSGLDDSFHSGAEGNFKLTGLPVRGKLWIVAMHPTEPLFAAQNVDPDSGARPQLILRPPVSARGRIVNEDGRPVKDARLRGHPEFPITGGRDEGAFRMSGSSAWQRDLERRLGQRDRFFLHVVTDANGKWQVEGLIPGAQYVFWIERPDGTDSRQRYEFIAPPDGVTDAGEVTLKD